MSIVTITETGTVVVRETETQVVTVVSPGEQGIPGPNTIGGFAINASGAIAGDGLILVGGVWVNRPIPKITVAPVAPGAPSLNDVWIDIS